MKRIVTYGLILFIVTLTAKAQSGTNSPYSQYGLGILSDQSQGFNRGMNGVGIALRQGNQVNVLNPASYSAVDSLTMIFDAGLSGQITNFKEGAIRQNAKNASFEYVVGSFRAAKNVGVSFGVLPFTNVGYSYSTSQYLPEFDVSIPAVYKGSGGLHQLFLGAGYRILPTFSIGANVSYLWGNLDRSLVTSSSTYIYSINKTYSASINSYKIDFGAQLELPLSKNDALIVGTTVGLGHKLGSDPELITQVGSSTPDTMSVDNGLEIPFSYGIGISYSRTNPVRPGNKLTIAADVLRQLWGSIDFPVYNQKESTYELQGNVLKDYSKLNVGAEWIPNAYSRKFLPRVHYRFGIGYATPYYYINNNDGPKEFSLSVGLGIPIMNNFNNRSILNVSTQWVRRSATDLISENSFRLNIGLTFNERWFDKWKVE